MEMTNRLHTPRTSIWSFSPTSYHSWTSEQPPHSSTYATSLLPEHEFVVLCKREREMTQRFALGPGRPAPSRSNCKDPALEKPGTNTYSSEARELGQDNLEGCPSGSSHFLNLPILPLPEGGKASWKHPLWPKVLALLPKRQNESVYIHFNSCES